MERARGLPGTMRPSDPWGCWGLEPRQHPWVAEITDTACGFLGNMTDRRCTSCIRQREERPWDQLDAAYRLRGLAVTENGLEKT